MTDSDVATTAPPALPTPQRSSGPNRARIVAIVASILGIVLCGSVPFLPIEQDTAVVNWPQAGSTTSVEAPLVSYTPLRMEHRFRARRSASWPPPAEHSSRLHLRVPPMRAATDLLPPSPPNPPTLPLGSTLSCVIKCCSRHPLLICRLDARSRSPPSRPEPPSAPPVPNRASSRATADHR